MSTRLLTREPRRAGRLERKRGSVGMADEMQLALGLLGDGEEDAQIGVGAEGLGRGPRI